MARATYTIETILDNLIYDELCNQKLVTRDPELTQYNDTMILTQYRDRPNTIYKKGGRFDPAKQEDDYNI